MGRQLILWATFALVMGFVLGGSFVATVLKPEDQLRYAQAENQSAQATNQESNERCEKIPFWNWRTCDPVAYFTFWLAGFTGILAVATVFLWVATQSILRESRRTTEKQLRAYINVVKAHTAFVDGRRPVFQIVMKNGGQTPAYKIIGRIQAFIRLIPPKNPLEFTAAVETRRLGTIGPNADYHMRLTGDLEMGDDMVLEIRERRRAIFVIGDVHYTDVFKHDWHTEFIVVFDDMSLEDPRHQLSAWTDGNEST